MIARDGGKEETNKDIETVKIHWRDKYLYRMKDKFLRLTEGNN